MTHPDHAAALALLDAGQDWAALAVLNASDAPRAGLIVRLIEDQRMAEAREQLEALDG